MKSENQFPIEIQLQAQKELAAKWKAEAQLWKQEFKRLEAACQDNWFMQDSTKQKNTINSKPDYINV